MATNTKRKKISFNKNLGLVILDLVANTRPQQISDKLMEEINVLRNPDTNLMDIWEKLLEISRSGEDTATDAIRILCRVDDMYEIKSKYH